MSKFDFGKEMVFVTNGSGKMLAVIDSGQTVFEEDYNLTPIKISGAPEGYRGYVPFGDDNLRPFELIKLHRDDEVLSGNKHFNTLCGYSGGLRVTNKKKNTSGNKADLQEEEDLPEEVQDFIDYNPLPYLWLEQNSDMKNFFYEVMVLIVSGDGKKIVEAVHKEAAYCRFESCNPANGRIEHIYYANWEKNPSWDQIEVIPLLDMRNPMGDFMRRMGVLPQVEGPNKGLTEMSTDRKFAICTKFPTVSSKYYPFHPSWSVFNSGWYDIKRLIPIAKKAKFKNKLSVRYVATIHEDYWDKLFRSEGITDPIKQKERATKEKMDFQNFLTGVENTDKLFMVGNYVNPRTGNPEPLVKFEKIDETKEGGEWLDDSEEGSNMLCYADGIHPSMVGATPGKNKGSFSGSDKRELFTMKQIMEKPFHDIMLIPYRLIAKFNKWDVKFDVPLLMLTTLDKGADAQPKSENAPVV